MTFQQNGVVFPSPRQMHRHTTYCESVITLNHPAFNILQHQHSPPRSPSTMATPQGFLLLPLFLFSILLITHQAKSADEETNDLLQGINDYRKYLNLTVLAKNDNAACFAQELANNFEDLPCTNSSGPNTVPGTEDQLSDYPELLSHCHLNISNTRDGALLPACVPNLDPSLVLANFTKSQYTLYLNDSKYTAAGVGSDGNWIVVVLSTNSSSGSFEADDVISSAYISSSRLFFSLLFLLMGLLPLL